jgi:uncharacterized protein YjbJ (UPF0337 family)
MGEHMDKTKGKIKQAAATLTGDAHLKREGERDEAKGRVKGAIDDAKHAAKDVKKSVKQVTK